MALSFGIPSPNQVELSNTNFIAVTNLKESGCRALENIVVTVLQNPGAETAVERRLDVDEEPGGTDDEALPIVIGGGAEMIAVHIGIRSDSYAMAGVLLYANHVRP